MMISHAPASDAAAAAHRLMRSRRSIRRYRAGALSGVMCSNACS